MSSPSKAAPLLHDPPGGLFIWMLVGFRFMDLRRAHRAWQAAYLGFTALFLTFFHFAM